MAASTGPVNSQRKESDVVSMFMGAVKINPGTLVSTRADGYLYPARAGTNTDVFAGVAYDGEDNSVGAAGAMRCRVFKTGTFVFPKTTATAQTDVGAYFYAADDSDVYSTSANNQKVGPCIEVIDGTNLRIRIDLAVS